MSRRFGLLLAAVLLGGCASGPAARGGAAASRFDDPSYGLTHETRFEREGPLEESPDWHRMMLAGGERPPVEFRAEDPVAATGARHYAWQAESPMEARPRRGRFFLSGFAAGFMARLAYGAYQGSGGQGVSGGNIGSAVLIGALTGLATWGFSFRLSPSQLSKASPGEEVPSLEDSSLYREWHPDRK